MFGIGFGELMMAVVAALVVFGPKELPKVLRKVGQWSGKLRRLAADMRAQSGIDEALRVEGLSDDIAEIRKLARGELDHVVSRTTAEVSSDVPASPYENELHEHHEPIEIDREREFPRDGADAYGALPDNAVVYAESFPASALASNALYTEGTEAESPALPEIITERAVIAEPSERAEPTSGSNP